MSRALVMLSGGIDSATALVWSQQNYSELSAISFQYHLRPFREQLAVYRLLQKYPANLIEVPLPFLKETADHQAVGVSHTPEGYIANRNMIFYSVAAHFAEIHGCEAIVGGHIRVDPESFQDASELFLSKLTSLINDALFVGKIRIELPLAKLDKVDVLQKAVEWNIPLQYTWSCYWDLLSPCGKCVSCQERAEAFHAAHLPDPLI